MRQPIDPRILEEMDRAFFDYADNDVTLAGPPTREYFDSLMADCISLHVPEKQVIVRHVAISADAKLPMILDTGLGYVLITDESP